MEKQSYIYILTNYEQTTLYVGITNNLVRRTFIHKEKFNKGFSKDYNLTQLVYYEVFPDILQAIARGKTDKRRLKTEKA